MPTARLGARRDVRIPKETARALRLRPGTKFDVHATDGVVVLVPSGRIPKSQRWFWTDEWQKKEREADEDLAAGRLKEFSDVEELIQDLHRA